jgi:hypothetical protein
VAQVEVFYEPEAELLTVFWQEPRPDQVCTELDDGVILIKAGATGEPIGIELLSYRPGDTRFGAVSIEIGPPPVPAATALRKSIRGSRRSVAASMSSFRSASAWKRTLMRRRRYGVAGPPASG